MSYAIIEQKMIWGDLFVFRKLSNTFCFLKMYFGIVAMICTINCYS